MKLSLLKIVTLITATTLCLNDNSSACTNFRLTAKDGSVVIARSMEYATDLNSNLRTSPRGRVFTTQAPDGKAGATWKAKYGYVFLDGMSVDFAVDGMNEVGLSVQDLYFPGYAAYQTVPPNHNSQAISYLYFADWALSNFKTVDEVRQALQTMYVFEQPISIQGMNNFVFPLHFALFDASGKGIVVEYIDGKLHIDDNQLGVATNSPSFDWHVTNQNNFVNLLPVNPAPMMDNGVNLSATGQGGGMVGLPGDISPPSRFVKMAVLTRVAYPANDAAGAVNLAEHIINNVDIPLGLAREPKNGHVNNETTQWVVFKDLTHKIFYYRNYDNLSLRAVDLSKLDFSENAPRLMMPIKSGPYVNDVTATFTASRQPTLPAEPMQQAAIKIMKPVHPAMPH
ncbi:MAG: hypothetical protein A3E85_00705 [Gammaproteobacteria bacterium RIFCSPHIGHO2_12_FULL_45_12]|nr:MAG: hypothetical protein A3E85_00705 [Gammaproteobacteria bacterium RIFCSPHIGHO2_12_FULL_45_12]